MGPCITYTPVPLLWRSWRKGVFSAALTLTLAASKALFKEVGGFSSSGSFFIIISKEFICNILETKKNKFLSFVDVRSVARPVIFFFFGKKKKKKNFEKFKKKKKKKKK